MPTPLDFTALIDPNWQKYSAGQTISYSFLNALPSDYPANFLQGNYLSGFASLTTSQQLAVRKIFDLIESITSLQFTQVAAGSTADIRFGNTAQTQSGGVNIRFASSANDPLRPINDIYISNTPRLSLHALVLRRDQPSLHPQRRRLRSNPGQ